MKQVRITRKKQKRKEPMISTGHNLHDCILNPRGVCLITHKEK